ncbi:tetratricopeptide repeat protein [Lachnospiraceae bacterium 62-35]
MKQRKKMLAAVLAALTLALSACADRKEEEEYRMTAIHQLEAGNYEGAISTFDLALKEADGRVGAMELDILKYRGEAEYKAGDYAAAAHTWDVLLQVDKKQPEYLYARSMAKAGEGKTAEALADYQAASDMDVQMDREAAWRKEALIAVGRACQAAGEEEMASRLYENALKQGIGQESAEIWNTLALACMADGNYEEALPFLEQGIAVGDDAQMADLLYNQAVAYEYTGEFEKALQSFEIYQASYGPDEGVEKEIAFLRTR